MSREPQAGFQVPKITRACQYILMASCALSLSYMLLGDQGKSEIVRYAAASGQSVWLEFKIWQLATSPFLEPEFVPLLFQSFMLWMFLPALERWWGMRRFFKFAAFTSLTGVVVGTVVGLLVPSVPDAYPIVGLDPFIYAGIVAYGTLFAEQQVRFFGAIPLTGKQLTIGICVFMLVFILLGQKWADGAAAASAMLLAWILTNGKWTPRVWWLKRKQARLRRHLKVVRDDKDKEQYLN